ncbi:MAG: Eco57I restriction-modification methylase domain-containing protein [Candidatus Aminicenantes bacterium]|nr:Eco57I restriction-modification methylase domain-containing protein [Candidatus Aminicenantes bacterium]
MDKLQARSLIRDILEKPFNKEHFIVFIKNLLNRIDETKAFHVRGDVKESFRNVIKTYERIGSYEAPDGKKIDIIIAYLQKSYSIHHARVTQRNFAGKYLSDRGQKDAGLFAFVSPDDEDWRFSLVKMEYKFEQTPTGMMKVKEEFTPARRWSFLVGANERSHTAQSRLVNILAEDEKSPTLEQIEEAFNIETVTKEFFREYRDLFIRTKEALDKVVQHDPSVQADFISKGVNTVDFAKKLLGQIIFLYFLQKKGWFGVARNAEWGSGSKNFLRELFESKHGKYKNFFNDILEPLFYDALSRDRSDIDHWNDHFKSKIPFLNGGLFDPIGNYNWYNTDILFPNDLFSNQSKTKEGDSGDGILDIFDRYNFTVKEDEPLEKEVAIDPELLGKAYEKFNAIRPDNFEDYKQALKSGKKGDETKFNKQFGVYYTPREIVHYMCQQSLTSYLFTELNSGRVNLEKIGDENLVLFDNKNKKGQLDFIVEHRKYPFVSKEEIEKLIHHGENVSENEARVESKGKETSTYYYQLPESIRVNAERIDQKLSEITVCDPAVGSGAFPVGMMNEIVRVRTVLTTFSDQKTNRTTYDFKRRCIEHSLYGVDIDPGAVEIAKLRLWLSLVVDEDDIKNIKPLPNLDYKIVCGNSLFDVEKNLFNEKFFSELEKIKPLYFNETNPTKKQKYKKQIDDLICQITNGHKEFDFEVFFSEVFHKKGGFDVMIANPPYISVEKFARTAQQMEWKRRFKTYASRGDIYCFFYERGLELIRDGGVLTFISSNKFQRTGYGRGLRQLLGSHCIQALIDFCELPVFDAATDPMIVIINKGAPRMNHEFPVVVIKDEAEFGSLAESLATRGVRYKPEQLKVDGWSLEGNDGLSLVDKLRSKGIPLVQYVKGRFYRGVITGFNEAFVINRAKRDRLIQEDRKSTELIKPWIRGKDIKRWLHEFHDLYIIIVRYGFHTELKKYPAISRHLAQFEKELKARGQCKTSRSGASEGQHHWLELDNNPAESYIAAFDESKIVFNETSKRLHAYFDKDKNVINKTGFIILTPDAPYVLAVLNSTLMDWFYRSTFPSWGDPWSSGRIQFRGNRMHQVPIPSVSSVDKSLLTKLVERASNQAKGGDIEGLRKTEQEIDEIVYRLFDLTANEIAHIKKSLSNTQRKSLINESSEDD